MTTPDRRFFWLRLYVLGWIPVMVVSVGAFHTSGIAKTWSMAGLDTLTYLGPPFLLGLFIRRTVHWGPSRKEHGLLNLLVQTALALGFGVLWQSLFIALLWLETDTANVVANLRNNQFFWQLLSGLLLYHLLAGVFYVQHLVTEIQKKEVAAARAESLRVRAEMAALRGQLDPHFLFNTLHSITALVREDPRRAEDALVQFAAMLRHVLELKRENGDELPLAKEMAFVDDYLSLEQLRLGDRLSVIRTITPEALDFWVPAFSIQPLVENAIRHALAPRREGGTITLDARVSGGRLIVTVSDNGPGTDSALLKNKDGIGLSALRQRLFLRHGESAQFQIATAPGQGFRVTLDLPAVREAVVESA